MWRLRGCFLVTWLFSPDSFFPEPFPFGLLPKESVIFRYAGNFANLQEISKLHIMKNLFSAAFIAAVAVLLSGCTSGSKYVIEGSGDLLVDGHWVYVSDGVDWSMLDSALIENGVFRIEGTDMGSGVAMLYMGASSAPSGLYQMSEMISETPGIMRILWTSSGPITTCWVLHSCRVCWRCPPSRRSRRSWGSFRRR